MGRWMDAENKDLFHYLNCIREPGQDTYGYNLFEGRRNNLYIYI